MYKGTTPTFTFTAPEGLDLTQATEIYVTFSRMNEVEIFTKKGDELTITSNSVEVYLTQEETLSFPDTVKIQINWTYQEGGKVKRACSNKMIVDVRNNLKDEVLK